MSSLLLPPMQGAIMPCSAVSMGCLIVNEASAYSGVVGSTDWAMFAVCVWVGVAAVCWQRQQCDVQECYNRDCSKMMCPIAAKLCWNCFVVCQANDGVSAALHPGGSAGLCFLLAC